MTVLDVSGLSISFSQYQRGLRRVELPVIRDLRVRVRRGEVVAVVGASGSGKSLLAHGIMGVLQSNAAMSGTINYMGEPLTQARREALRGREIVLVPQGVTALDPLMAVGKQVRGAHRGGAARTAAAQALGRYGLGRDVEALYPFELSGGMARRVLIATATMTRPSLVIADEPTPGLHIEAARRVLTHFRELADEGAAVLLITHDLGLALAVADRVSVFYAGVTVEDALAADFASPDTLRHPYSRALWRAMPEHGFSAIEGRQLAAGDGGEGCPFAPRCADKVDACRGDIPWQAVRGGHVRCVHGGGEKGGA